MKLKNQTPGTLIVRLIMLIIAGIFLIIIVMPYIFMLLTSFRATSEIVQNPGRIVPINWTLSGYITVLTKSPYLKWFANSVIVTVSVTVAVLFTSSITGFIFAKYNFKGKDFLFWIVLATMMVPFAVTMIPGFLVINELGLYNTLWALIVPSFISGFGIFLCRQFCAEIPGELCEAAKIDGASDFSIYLRIILPLLRPCLGALAIFTFLEKWNDYLGPLLMLDSVDNMTLPLSLSYFSSQHYNDYSAVMAASALIMMPVTAVFIILQKQFIKGIAITGLK